VFVINSLRTGGAERHLVRLIGGLEDGNRWKTSVYCLSREGPFLAELAALGVPVLGSDRRWTATPWRLLSAFVDLWRSFRQERPAIVHCYLPPAIALGAVAARLARVPRVITTRRIVHTYEGRRAVLYRLVTAIADMCSDCVIAVCETAREQAIQEGTPASKLVTIYNAVPASQAGAKSPEVGAGTPVYGTVGELHPRKGLTNLLRAIPSVLRTLPESRFVIVGSGPERALLVKMARDLGVSDRVTFLGNRNDVAAVLASLDVFVLPSIAEGLPNALLEAMAAGLPVVATAVGGVPEIVQSGVNGMVVEPAAPDALAEALVRLGQDERLRSEYGAANRALVASNFSVERELAETTLVYRRLLDQLNPSDFEGESRRP
jgi:glycosyltransferase involved in cell wall biosynthesis